MPAIIPEVWKMAKAVILRVRRIESLLNKKSTTVKQRELMKQMAKILAMLNKMSGTKSERTSDSCVKLRCSMNYQTIMYMSRQLEKWPHQQVAYWLKVDDSEQATLEDSIMKSRLLQGANPKADGTCQRIKRKATSSSYSVKRGTRKKKAMMNKS